MNILCFFLLGCSLITTTMGTFFHMDSIKRCYDMRCPRGDYFHYYTCNVVECDFHLQPWVYAISFLMVIVFLYSVICALMKFVCYFRQPSFYDD